MAFLQKTQISMQHFGEYVTPIYDDLYRFVFSYTYDKDLTDDAVQNTLLKAYDKFYQLRDHSKFKSWIFSIGKREAYRLIRDRVRHRYSELDSTIEDIEMDMEDAIDILINQETKSELAAAIDSLPKKYQVFIRLRYGNNLPLNDIARILNLNQSTARSWNRRIKSQIASKIDIGGD